MKPHARLSLLLAASLAAALPASGSSAALSADNCPQQDPRLFTGRASDPSTGGAPCTCRAGLSGVDCTSCRAHAACAAVLGDEGAVCDASPLWTASTQYKSMDCEVGGGGAGGACDPDGGRAAAHPASCILVL
jgi:hypothetical protein